MSVSEARDVAVVVLAIVALTTLVIGTITAFFVWRFVSMLREEIQPIIRTMSDTATTIKSAADSAADSTIFDFARLVSSNPIGKLISLLFRRAK